MIPSTPIVTEVPDVTRSSSRPALSSTTLTSAIFWISSMTLTSGSLLKCSETLPAEALLDLLLRLASAPCCPDRICPCGDW